MAEIKKLTFEGWIKYVFETDWLDGTPRTGTTKSFIAELESVGCQITNGEDTDSIVWLADRHPRLSLELTSRLFEDVANIATPYDNLQLKNGLWQLVSEITSPLYVLRDGTIEWTIREKCIQAIYTVCNDLFAKRCDAYLSSKTREENNPLNTICYMWWDTFPIYGQPENPESAALDNAILVLFEKILTIKAVATQESTLHGLGHWQPYYPLQVKRIVTAFLDQSASLQPGLREYAERAIVGAVQ